MDFFEIEKELEMRNFISKGIYDRMHELRYHIEMELKHLGEYLKMEKEGASFEELEMLTLGGLRKAVVEGDVTHGSVMAGQIAGLIKEELTCRELIQKLVKETDDLIKGAKFYE